MADSSQFDVIRDFVRYLNAGAIDDLMSLYEPDAAYVTARGDVARGPAIRAAFEQSIQLAPRMSGTMEHYVDAGSIALVRNRWRLTGTRPDGSAVDAGGLSAVVLRRRADGTWGVVIDDPWGRGE